MSAPAATIPQLPSRPAGLLRRPVAVWLAMCLLLLGLEAWIFLYQSDDWDVYVYHTYGQYYNIEDASLEDLYSDNTVEYPPLAVALMIGTDTVAQKLPLWRGLPAQTYDPDDDQEPFNKFKVLYRLEMAAVVFGTFLLLGHLWRTSMPRESLPASAGRFAVFCAGLALLSPFVFDRLDAVMGALMLLALALMLGRRHYAWSFLALAVAIAFKFVPIVLGPLWVAGSLPVAMIAARKAPGGMRRLLLAATGRGMLLAAFTFLLYLPFVWFGGEGSLDFLTYHSERGIEFGSTYAALLGVLKYAAGLKISGADDYGSHNIVSSLSPWFTRFSPVIMLGFLAAATLLLLADILRASDRFSTASSAAHPAGVRVGRAFGGKFTQHAMLLLLIFIFANKVFSPQYLLWILPLAPAMPLPPRRRGLFQLFQLGQVGFLALCLITILIYPCFIDDTLGLPLPGHAPGHLFFAGPTPFGVLLLAGRALLLAALIAGVAAHLLRSLRPAAAPQREAAEPGEIPALAIDQSPAV